MFQNSKVMLKKAKPLFCDPWTLLNSNPQLFLVIDLRLRQLGLDSISAVFLKGRLSELFGGSLPGGSGSREV